MKDTDAVRESAHADSHAEDDAATIWKELTEQDEVVDDGPEWTVESEPEPEPAAEPEAPEASVPEVDATKPDYDAIVARNAELEQQVRSERGRAKGQQLRAEALKRQLDEITTRRSTESDAAKAALESVKEEYGDVVGPLAEELTSLKSRLAAEDSNRELDIKAELQSIEQAEEAVFLEAAPNGMGAIKANREAFVAWIEDQPKVYRDAFEVNLNGLVDGRAAALVVNRFEQHLLEADRAAEAARTQQQDTPVSPAQTNNINRLASRRGAQMAGAQATRTAGRQAAAAGIPKDSEDLQAHWDSFA